MPVTSCSYIIDAVTIDVNLQGSLCADHPSMYEGTTWHMYIDWLNTTLRYWIGEARYATMALNDYGNGNRSYLSVPWRSKGFNIVVLLSECVSVVDLLAVQSASFEAALAFFCPSYLERTTTYGHV